jgi:hypothetical protein
LTETQVDAEPEHPDPSVTVRSYSPELELDADDIVEFCEPDEYPLGPDQV